MLWGSNANTHTLLHLGGTEQNVFLCHASWAWYRQLTMQQFLVRIDSCWKKLDLNQFTPVIVCRCMWLFNQSRLCICWDMTYILYRGVN